VSWDVSTGTRINANEVTGAEVPPETVPVRDPARAHAELTIEPAAVTAAAILAVSVLEARALLIASAQSLGAPRIARTAGAITLIEDMIAVGRTMITSAQSLRVMARLCTPEGTGRGEITRRLRCANE
jgi:hypothetical protein